MQNIPELVGSKAAKKAFWDWMIATYPPDTIRLGLESLQPDTARVIQLHYLMGYPLTRIGSIINRSMTVVYNHHNRGIVNLYKYCLRLENRLAQFG